MTSTIVSVEQVARLPLYRNLGREELEEVMVGLHTVRIEDGEALIRQGDRPDGAYFVMTGKVRVLTKLPGGGETLIAEAGPGSMLGELALIRSSRRSATVRANGPVEALLADGRYFRAAMAQLRPAAIKVSRNIAEILAQRLHQQHMYIREHIEAQTVGSYFTAPPKAAGSDTSPREPSFDVRAFLPVLPCFRDFDAPDLDRLVEFAEIEEASAGAFLNSADDTTTRAFIVVRGAAVSCLPHGEEVHQLTVLGPGRFCAIGTLLGASPSPVRHFVRHSATLLAFPADRFVELIDGLDQLSLRFLNAVNEHQAAMVIRAGNNLTRLVGLSRLYRQMEESTTNITL